MRNAIIAPQKNKPIEIIRIGLSSIQERSVAPSFRIQANRSEKIPSMSWIVAVDGVSAAKAGNAYTAAIAEAAAGKAQYFL